MTTRNREWKGSLLITALIAFVVVSHLDKPLGLNLETLCRSFLALSLGYIARQAQTQFRNRKKACNSRGDCFSGPLPVPCPCGCKIGFLKNDGRNTQGTFAFLECNVCKCVFRADDAKRDFTSLRLALANHGKATAEESLFQRKDGSWGWYDETWNEGDSVKYVTREAASRAQALYVKNVLGT